MVAIVAGQGLGLVNTSGSLLGSPGQIGTAGQGTSGEKVTVNAATGNLIVQQQDEWLVGRGPDAAVLRTYNSQGGSDGDNGDQWRLGLSRKIQGLTGTINTAGSKVTRIGEDGAETVFTYSATQGAYISWAGAGSLDTLRHNAGVWTWTDHDSRTTETYDAAQNGRLTAVIDASGNALTIGYSGGLVSIVTDASGGKTYIDYYTEAGKTTNVKQVRTVDGANGEKTRVAYSYDSANRLTRVTVDLTPDNTSDSKTYVTDYSYVDDSSRKLASLKQSDGSELQFAYDASGRILTVKDVRGGDVRTTTFDYSVTGQTNITDANNRVVRLKYSTATDQNQQQLLSIDAPGAGSARQVTAFTYDANGNVKTATNALGNVSAYGYDSLGNRIYERDAAGNVVERIFGIAGQLLTETGYMVRDPDGAGSGQPSQPLTTRYVYDDKQRLRFAIGPDGQVIEHQYDAFGQKKSETVFRQTMPILQGWSQNFAANADGLTTLPDGIKLVPGGLQLATRAASGHVWPIARGTRTLPLGSSLHVEVTAGPTSAGRGQLMGLSNGQTGAAERRYVAYFEGSLLRVHVIDASGKYAVTLGNVTNGMTYEIDLVTEPSGAATLYVYEKGKDRSSGFIDRRASLGWTSVQTYLETHFGQGVGATSILISELTETAAYTEQTLATWTATQSAAAQSRTNFTYDVRGQLASKTVDGTQSTTNYVYDQYGNLLKVIDPRGVATSIPGDYVTGYAYDGLHRMVTQTDALNNATFTVYDDANRKVTTTSANGLVTVALRDQGGRLLSVVSSDNGAMLGTVTYAYDKLGRRVKTTDATGLASYTLYDEAGRVSAQIDAMGVVTEYLYDRRDQLVLTIAYANKLSATALSGLAANPGQTVGAVRPVTHADDRSTRRLYNVAGQLAKTIDAAGAVTQLQYDGLGRQIGTVQYAGALSSTQMAALAGLGTEILPDDADTVPASDAANDRRTRQIWSDGGLLAATVDAEGYVVEHKYNGAGQRTQTIRYATRTVLLDWSSATLIDLRPTHGGQDQTDLYLYSALGQLEGAVDAEGYLTEYQHDLSGNRTAETRYATRITYVPGNGVLASRPSDSGLDRKVLRQFDAMNRLVREESLPDGLVTAFTYDVAGNLVKTVRGDGTPVAEQRAEHRQYDALGRLTAELGPRGAAALAQFTSPTAAQIVDTWERYGTRHLYDVAGRRTASIEPDGTSAKGNKTLYYYDYQGRMTHSINALGEVKQYEYNSFGEQVLQKAYATRLATTTLASLNGGLAISLDITISSLANIALDSLQQTGYDLRGLVASRTDALSNADIFAYNAFGEQSQRVERIDAGRTTQTDLVYDRRGSVRSSTADTGAGKLNLVTSAVYDAFRRVTQSTDARSNTTLYAYDKLGRTVTTTDPLTHSRTTSYDAFGRVVTQRDALGQETSYTYDGPARTLTAKSPLGIQVVTSWNRHGQTVSVTDGRGNATLYTYDVGGQLTSTAPAGAGTTSTTYDAAGRTISTQDARGTITEYKYDAANRILSRKLDPNGLALITSFEYDALGRTVKATAPDTTVTFSEFDQDGNLTAVTQDHGAGRLNLRTSYTYDAQGRTLSIVEGTGVPSRTTQYEYDVAGRRVNEIVDPAGLALTTRYVYDRNDNVIERIDAAASKTRYVYDANNLLRYTVDALGSATRLLYDANGRVVETLAFDKAVSLPVLADPAAGHTVTQLDALVAGIGGRVARTLYDSNGRVQYTMDALGTVTKREYDAASNVVAVLHYGDRISTAANTKSAVETALVSLTPNRQSYIVYDVANRPVYEIDALNYVTSTTYDTAGLVTKQTRHAKAITVPATRTTANVAQAIQLDSADRNTYWAYDTLGRKRFEIDAERYVSEVRYDQLGRERFAVRYRNPVTVPTTVSEGTVAALVVPASHADDVTTEMSYDAAGRVTEEVNGLQIVTRYTHDALGNVLSKTSAYGRAEKIQTDYTYDLAGRKLSETVAPGTPLAATTRYSYDAMGRLRTVLRPAGVELVTSDSNWAKDERARLGYATTLGGLITTKRDQLRALHTTEYRYDTEGRLSHQIDTAGTTIYTRNAFGETISLQASSGAVTYTVRDALGRETGVIDAEGYLTQSVFDAFGNRTAVGRYPNKVQGNLAQAATYGIVALSAGQAAPTNGACWIYTDTWATNVVELFEYDKLNRLASVKDAEGHIESKVIDAFGNATSVVNKLGGIAGFTYDRLGRVLTETLPIKAKDATGVLVSVVNSYLYDARGNRTQTVEAVGLPEARTTTYLFDKANREIQKTGMAFTAFDAATGAVSTVKPAELTRYDGNGNVIEVVVNANVQSGGAVGGARSLRYYDAAGRKVAQLGADGAYTAYTYTPNSQVWRETAYATVVALPSTAGGTAPAPKTSAGIDRVTSNSYTGLGSLARSRRESVLFWEPPLTGTDISMALQNSQPSTVVLGRLLYDASGNVVQEIDARENSIFSYYDKLGRKTLSIDQEGYATAWEYGHLSQAAVKETRFANRVTVTYGRQNDAAVPAALRDPLNLRASIVLSTNDRVTVNTLDRLGHVTEKRIKNVAAEYVDAAGVPIQRMADAVTGYSYDGLGNVTQIRERVAVLANGTEVLNVTDVEFDKLGRQVRRLAPGYADQTDFFVRPTSETEYNGWGNIKRSIERGTNNASEADDRITQYGYNANGDRIQVIDAETNVTNIAYDALRRAAQTVVLAVKDAGDNVRNVETRLAYDAIGRLTMQQDMGTGEVRRTAYNAFGEISKKGLADGWQEYIEYNTLGKIQRSNTEGGVSKIYLYDRTGNTTRLISSATTDLRTVSVISAAQDATLMHTFSAYDKRNQLVRTVEPDISFLRDEVSMQQIFTQQLTDLYGPISVANAGGGNYTGGTVDPTGHQYTQVAGTSGSVLLGGAAGPGNHGGWSTPGVNPLRNADTIDLTAMSALNWGWESTSIFNWNSRYGQGGMAISIPADWPNNFTYRVIDFNGITTTINNGNRSSPIHLSATHYHDLESPYWVDTLRASVQIFIGNAWVEVSALTSRIDRSRSIQVGTQGDSYVNPLVATSVEPDRLIFKASPSSSENQVSSWYAEDLSQQQAANLSVSQLLDVNGNPVVGFFQLKGGETAVRLNGLSSSGIRVAGVQFYFSKNNGVPVVSNHTPVLKPDILMSGAYMLLNSDAVGGSWGQIYYRKAEPEGVPRTSWSVVAFSGSAIHTSIFGLNQGYEFFIKTSNKETYSWLWKDVNGVTLASSGMLYPINRAAPLLTFDLTGQSLHATEPGLTYVVDLNFVAQDGSRKSFYHKPLNGTLLTIDVTSELSELGITPYINKVVDYGLMLYAVRSDGVRQLISSNWGQVQLGSDLKTTLGGNGYYRPVARLTLPPGTVLTGALIVKPLDAPASAVAIPSGHWSRKSDGNGLNIDLSYWFTATSREVEISYELNDAGVNSAKFTAKFRINQFGFVEIIGAVSNTTRESKIPLTIAGATRLSVLKVGLSKNASVMSAVDMASVTTAGSTFTWNAKGQENLGVRWLYYEAVNAAGQLVGKGYGWFTLDANGVLNYHPETPELRPAFATFTPPAGTTSFEIGIRIKGSGALHVSYLSSSGAFAIDGGAYSLAMQSWLPQSDARELDIYYKARNAAGELLSDGDGVLRIDSAGVVTVVSKNERREPAVVTLQGPPGNQEVAKLKMTLKGQGTGGSDVDIWINGQWNAAQNRTIFRWDAKDWIRDTGTVNINYLLSMHDANGIEIRNEIGDLITINGVMTLGGHLTEPVQMRQIVTTFIESAQVERLVTYNAFGEIAEEYDERVEQRAQAMKARYGGTVDANAVRTTLQYNTMGQLITKIDPQTHVTAENGYRGRERPVTQFGYDLLGRLVSSTDANGNVSRQNYVGEGTEHVGKQWGAEDGTVSQTQYDVFGNARKLTDELQAVTLQDFDKLGRLKLVQRTGITRAHTSSGDDAVGSTLEDSYTYDALGQRITHTNARNWTDKTYYDNLGRVIKTTTAEGRSTLFSYSFVAAGQTSGIFGAGNQNTGGYQRKTTYADGRFVLDNIDYFGLVNWHMDMSGRNYLYNYDWGGRLTSQFSNAWQAVNGQMVWQHIEYSYFFNGYLREARDFGEGTMSRYGYDNAGNRVWEAYNQMSAEGQPGASYQSNRVEYDELNRMSSVQDDTSRVDVQYEYDAVGNRRAVHAFYLDPSTQGTLRKDELWYAYDKMNRFVVSMGSLSNGRGSSKTDTSTGIVLGNEESVLITYNKASQRKTVLDHDGNLETYTYSQDGYLEDAILNGARFASRRVDALGRTLEYIDENNKSVVSTYDHDNRVVQETSVDGVTKYFYATDTADTDALASQSGAGSLLRTEFTPVGKGTATRTWYRYEYWDEAKQSQIKVQAWDAGASAPKWAPGFSQLSYNVNGFLKSAYDDDAKLRTSYVTSAHGQVLQRTRTQNDQPVGTHNFYYADGRRIGDVTDDDSDRTRVSYAESLAQKDKTVDRRTLYKNFKPVTSSDFDQNYEPISRNYPAAVGSTYTVRGGETLQTIAQALWGDAAMWYMLAEANGLSGGETLVAGVVLHVPNKVTNIHNNADTFRPYNPGEAIGRIDPTLPAPPPPKKGCGGIGQIIMIVVAVVATIYTAGAAAGFTSSFAASMSAGATVLTGGGVGLGLTTAGALGAAAVGGAVGSIASQAAGMAMGMQDSFSWKQVGLSALGAGVTAGIGVGATSAWAGAGRAAVSSVATQGLGMALGLQDRFSWAGVAASAVGAGVGRGIGNELIGSTPAGTALGNALGSTGRQIVSGMAGSVVAQLVGSGRVDARSAFANTLGNALGDSLAAASGQRADNVPGPVSAAERADILGYFADGPGDGIPRVNGLTFSQDTAMRRATLDPYNLADARALAATGSGVTTLDIDRAQQRVYQTGQKPIYDFGDPLEGGDIGDQFAGGSVRVMRGNAVGRGGVNVLDPIPSTVNGVSVNQRADSLFQGMADLVGAGDMYRDIKLIGALMSDREQQNTIDRLKGTLQDKLGMMRVLPSEADLGAVQGVGSDGVSRYDKQDLIDRYSDANRKVELMKAGVIELDTRSMLITSVGTAKLTPNQWVAENTQRYQAAFTAGMAEGQQLYKDGQLYRYPLDMPGQLQVGLFADEAARSVVINYNKSIGVPEGAGQLLSMNRWSYDPSGSGNYNRIDLLMDMGPSRNNGALILRTAIEGKSSLDAVQSSGAQLQRVQNWVTPLVYTVTPQGTQLYTPRRLK